MHAPCGVAQPCEAGGGHDEPPSRHILQPKDRQHGADEGDGRGAQHQARGRHEGGQSGLRVGARTRVDLARAAPLSATLDVHSADDTTSQVRPIHLLTLK